VDLAIQNQRVARGKCGWGEDLVVRARGTSITVKVGGQDQFPPNSVSTCLVEASCQANSSRPSAPFSSSISSTGCACPRPLNQQHQSSQQHQPSQHHQHQRNQRIATPATESAATIPKKRKQAPVTDSSSPKAASREQVAANLRSLETFLDEFLVQVQV